MCDPSPFTTHPEALKRQLADYRTGALASVEASTFEAAVDLIAEAVGVLRVFQHVRSAVEPLPQFEVAGEIGQGVLPCMIQSPNEVIEFVHRGGAEWVCSSRPNSS